MDPPSTRITDGPLQRPVAVRHTRTPLPYWAPTTNPAPFQARYDADAVRAPEQVPRDCLVRRVNDFIEHFAGGADALIVLLGCGEKRERGKREKKRQASR